MPDSTPTASCPAAAGASTFRVNRRFRSVSVGNITTATRAKSTWTMSRLTSAAAAMTMTDNEKASGLSIDVATSTSASAWARSWPAGRDRWKANGTSRNRSVTARRHVRWVLTVASMLNHRRIMIDTPRTIPTAITTATAVTTDRRDTPSPPSPGTITSSVIRPMTTVKPTTARANTLAPMMAAACDHGCRRRDRQISRPPRRTTLSGTGCPERVLRAGRRRPRRTPSTSPQWPRPSDGRSRRSRPCRSPLIPRLARCRQPRPANRCVRT